MDGQQTNYVLRPLLLEEAQELNDISILTVSKCQLRMSVTNTSTVPRLDMLNTWTVISHLELVWLLLLLQQHCRLLLILQQLLLGSLQCMCATHLTNQLNAFLLSVVHRFLQRSSSDNFLQADDRQLLAFFILNKTHSLLLNIWMAVYNYFNQLLNQSINHTDSCSLLQ